MQVDAPRDKRQGGGGYTEPDAVGEGEARRPVVTVRELSVEAKREAAKLIRGPMTARIALPLPEWFNIAQLTCIAVAQPEVPNHARAAGLDFVVDVVALLGKVAPALADALLQAVPVPDGQGEDWDRIRGAYVDSMRHVNARSNGRAH